MGKVAFSNSIQIEGVLPEELNDKLARVDPLIRQRVKLHAFRVAAKLVLADVRPRIPKPGYRGDQITKTNLRKAMGQKVYGKGRSVTALVGARLGQFKGFHSHLHERGHEVKPRGRDKGPRRVVNRGAYQVAGGGIRRKVEGRRAIERAAKSTAHRQRSIILKTIADAAEEGSR